TARRRRRDDCRGTGNGVALLVRLLRGCGKRARHTHLAPNRQPGARPRPGRTNLEGPCEPGKRHPAHPGPHRRPQHPAGRSGPCGKGGPHVEGGAPAGRVVRVPFERARVPPAGKGAREARTRRRDREARGGGIVSLLTTSVGSFPKPPGLTKRPLKGMLTGPYTMMDWSFNEHYPSREDLALAFAKVLHAEARDLQRAGARVIQIDEPALSARTDELDLVVKALGAVTQGLDAKTITHTCYGNYDTVFPYFNRLPVDQLDLEMSNSGLDLLERFQREPLKKEIAFGVIDVHSHVIEPESLIRERMEKALTIFSPSKLLIDPDCGLKTRSVDEARIKLRNMVAAAHAVR